MSLKVIFFLIIILFFQCSNPMETEVLHGVTTISLVIPKSGKAKIKTENSYGTTIEVLADRFLSSGNYSFKLDNEKYHEGLYFYSVRINSEEYFTSSFLVSGK